MAPAIVYRFGWVPVCGVAVWAGFQYADSYTKVYNTVRWVDKAQGVQHDHPDAQTITARVLSVGASIGVGAATFEVFRRILYRILLAPHPREIRAAEAAGLPVGPQPLSLRRIVALVGPRATAASYREFRNVYGLQFACIAMASAWAIVAAPVAHAKMEAAFAPVGATEQWGQDTRQHAATQRRDAQIVASLQRADDERVERSIKAAEEELKRRKELKDSFKS
jgi:hypothetical protein